jgi:hypothetical protein
VSPCAICVCPECDAARSYAVVADNLLADSQADLAALLAGLCPLDPDRRAVWVMR